jgi:glyoxylase-like metal-dependent hydrolase (beta-lactamase superfamily II)
MPYQVHNVGCAPGGDAFLITTDGKNALVDTGFLFTAKGVLKKVKDILGDRELDYILLTHSHYDHVSGATTIKKAYPKAVIVSAEHAAKVFTKPSAIKTMGKLNRAAAIEFRRNPFYLASLKGLHTDLAVKEGDVIDLGSLKLTVLETPGHTWDTIAFWCEEESFLISNESAGVLTSSDTGVAQCLVSHRKSVEYIQRAKELDPQHMLVPHFGMVHGEDSRKVLDIAERSVDEIKELVLSARDQGMSKDEILAYVKEKLWVGPLRQGQPEKAFDLNNRYMVPVILSEYP